MTHIEGSSRYQRIMLGPSLDEMVRAEHPVRVIDAFVDSLDLAALGFRKVEPQAAGRPGYKPGDLLKLYLYGYGNEMRSSRRLEEEAVRNLEVQWLINRLTPPFTALADFRKDNAGAIIAAGRDFVQFCRGQSPDSAPLAATEGAKLEAGASRRKVSPSKAMTREAAEIGRKIGRYLKAMDEADREEAAAETYPADVVAALKTLRLKRMQMEAQA